MEIEIETASRNGPFWFFGGQSCQSRVVSDPGSSKNLGRVRASRQSRVSGKDVVTRKRDPCDKTSDDVPSAGTGTASAGSASHRPGRSNTLLRLVFRGRGRVSVSGARGFAGDRVKKKTSWNVDACCAVGESGRLGCLGRVRGLRGARARRFRATYLRGPPRAPPTWCVGDPSRTPWRRTGWLACKDASNGVGVNARCDAGWTREFRVANALWRVAELVTRASESTRAIRARRLTSRLSVAVARGGAREVW